jgi:putative sigma-54 modulation protein
MNKRKIPKGVVIDIQATAMTINGRLQKKIFNMIEKFQRFFTRISWADFYMTESPKRSAFPRAISVRLGIPGSDIYASDTGKTWNSLMTRVEKRIMRQLIERKQNISLFKSSKKEKL